MQVEGAIAQQTEGMRVEGAIEESLQRLVWCSLTPPSKIRKGQAGLFRGWFAVVGLLCAAFLVG